MPDILVLNEKSNIGIATLWTKKEVVLAALQRMGVDSKVNIIGTLYTKYGINHLLYTLSRHPEINTLIIFGADLSGSGYALVELFKGRVVEGLRLMWTLEELKPILETVKVLDLREEFKKGNYQSLAETIEQVFSPGTYRSILNLELREVEASTWPEQVAGLVVVEEDILRAWAKLLDAVTHWGYVKASEYGERQKQLLGVEVVLYAEEALAKAHRLEAYFSRDELQAHVKSLLEGLEGASYSYGERLRRHRLAGDQIESLVSRLATSPATRRAIALTWDFTVDPSSQDPPCLILVQGDVSGNKYNQLAYFRSHDVYAGWPVNVYGLLRLMENVSSMLTERMGRQIRPGFLTVFSASLHLYEHDWARAREVIMREKHSFRSFIPDPKGNFIIRLSEGKIILEHRDSEGVLAASYSGGTAKEILDQVNLDALMPRHASYLTRELLRAEAALREGKEYVQDAV
ncbi:MAG: thymidylate synthase [Infirmifilum sp.]